MGRGWAIAAAALVWAGLTQAPAAAQELIPGAEARNRPPPAPRPRVHLFISPAGEPFRQDDGLAAWLAQADADRDGAVTLAEFQADALAFFKTLDTDHNGVIDGFEVGAYERNIAPEITQLPFEMAGAGGGRPPRAGGGGMRGPGGPPGGGASRGGPPAGPPDAASGQVRTRGAGPDGAARYSLINEPQPISAADADYDHKVTLKEWERAGVRRFDLLDKAKTGRLTLDSLRPPAPEKKKR